jgi:lipopolysaccharide export system protein LptA
VLFNLKHFVLLKTLRASRLAFATLLSCLALSTNAANTPALSIAEVDSAQSNIDSATNKVMTNNHTEASAENTTEESNVEEKNTDKDFDSFHAPISIAADSAEQNEKKGVTIYRGNVSIEQGNLTISADTVTIQSTTKTSDESANDNNRQSDVASNSSTTRSVTTIVANGLPARFTQLQPGQSQAINAEGNTIRYAIDTGIILLEQNASIDKLGSKVSGEKIEYYINEELVKAEADPNDKNTRVHTIITPGA